jgi:uncharacterized UPF0160 family protein
MTDAITLIEKYTAALKDYQHALELVKDKAISPDERLLRLDAAEPFWDRFVELKREVDKLK